MIYFQHAFFLFCVFNLEAISGPEILCIFDILVETCASLRQNLFVPFVMGVQ